MAVSDGLFVVCHYVYALESVIPMIEIAVSILTIVLLKPFLFSTGKILLQQSPDGKQKETLLKCLRQVSLIDGVVMIADEHFWN
jgi:hypothetical protein